MILNRTTRASERYRIIPGNAGNYGDPSHYPTHKYMIVSGVDRGNGYQGYMSVTYMLEEGPVEVRSNLIKFLRSKGYERYLREKHFERLVR